MTIPHGIVHLVKQGYRAWLHDEGLAAGPEAARRFAAAMTDDGRHPYESLNRVALEDLLRDEH